MSIADHGVELATLNLELSKMFNDHSPLKDSVTTFLTQVLELFKRKVDLLDKARDKFIGPTEGSLSMARSHASGQVDGIKRILSSTITRIMHHPDTPEAFAVSIECDDLQSETILRAGSRCHELTELPYYLGLAVVSQLVRSRVACHIAITEGLDDGSTSYIFTRNRRDGKKDPDAAH
jgi:hypothetical protein